MKKVIFIIIVSVLFSCQEKKIEFISSKTMPNIFFIKNSKKDESLKKNIEEFLLRNPDVYKNQNHIGFYKYTSNTKYFIDHDEDPGGFSSEELSNYPEDELATFIIVKCKTDTTKRIGELNIYNEGYPIISDTIIYKCQ